MATLTLAERFKSKKAQIRDDKHEELSTKLHAMEQGIHLIESEYRNANEQHTADILEKARQLILTAIESII